MRVHEFTTNEDLRKWFKDKWVRFGPDGKIRGDCARDSSSEGKPKCLPQKKAHALGKKKRATAAGRKRREDPNKNRKGAAKNVATEGPIGKAVGATVGAVTGTAVGTVGAAVTGKPSKIYKGAKKGAKLGKKALGWA